MRKIPTLFRRDPENMSRVLREVHPDCQWVLDGEGKATRKYDGACVMYDGGLGDGSGVEHWWARREVKPGKSEPEGFRAEQRDEETGKTVGWEPIEQSAFYKTWLLALGDFQGDELLPGTYELIGPKINGNPERATGHYLMAHDTASRIRDDGGREPARNFDRLMSWLCQQDGHIEGIVWHHPDGRMAKLKCKDAKATLKHERDVAQAKMDGLTQGKLYRVEFDDADGNFSGWFQGRLCDHVGNRLVFDCGDIVGATASMITELDEDLP